MRLIFFFLAIICTSFVKGLSDDKMLVKQKKVLDDSTIYSNKLYKMVVFRKRGKLNRFKIYNVRSLAEFIGRPELIIIDGEIPEGTNRIDYNNPNDLRGYPCDSSYGYSSDRFRLAFALEKGTKRRLDLIISGSKDKNFKDGGYTLIMR